jgi:hypothetical protein
MSKKRGKRQGLGVEARRASRSVPPVAVAPVAEASLAQASLAVASLALAPRLPEAPVAEASGARVAPAARGAEASEPFLGVKTMAFGSSMKVDAEPPPAAQEPQLLESGAVPTAAGKNANKKTLLLGSERELAVAKAPSTTAQASVQASVQASRVAASKDDSSLDTRIDEDEESIPPVGDVDVEEFFAVGQAQSEPGPHAFVAAHDHHDDEPLDDLDLRRRQDPAVAERRARFTRVVRAMVAVAAVLTAIGFVRGAMSKPASAETTSSAAASLPAAAANNALVQVPQPAAEAPKAPPVANPAVPVAVAANAEPESVKAEPAKVDPESAKAEPAKAEPAKVEPPVAEPAAVAAPASDKSAKEEKGEARKALERGKPQLAIEAGERSVALDPTDGEAWLLLGAAYMDRGKPVEARKAFASCVKQGKKGPMGECAAMLR